MHNPLIHMKAYFDNAATTPVDLRVLAAMKPFFTEKYGNASSLHSWGSEAREALEESRDALATAMNAKPQEIFFTSGGTESDNLALKGVALANRKKGNHVIISSIEHPAVLETAEWLASNGFKVTKLPVDKRGVIVLSELEKKVTPKTLLVSIMHANNEIGTIEPIVQAAAICHEHGVLFHTDAVQTFGKIPFDAQKLGVDLASFSSHKMHGPKGVGALFVRSGVRLEPLAHGGGQERGLRSGTENVAGIVGFSKASQLAVSEMKKEAGRLEKIRDNIVKRVLEVPNSWLNGHPTQRLPNNAHFCFKFVEGESLVLRLDAEGIATSTGSACSSHSLEPSHVLLSLGLRPEEAHSSLRVTLGRQNTDKEADHFLKVLPSVVKDLRRLSPFKKSYAFKPSRGFENKRE